MNHILKTFFHWLLCAGTLFFASGAVIDAGALDGADGGGVDDGVGSHQDESTAAGDDGLDADRGSESAGADASQGAERSGDGRTLPKEVQTALKTLKEAHPEHAKALEELRKSYFSSKQHGEFFKTPAEARQAKATLELVGGSEGIATLQSQVAAMEMVDTAFEQGDPQVLDDIASDFPEGFKKLVGPALDKLQSLDPKSYASTLQPHTFAAMEAAGLGPVLDAVGQALTANDLAKAKDLIGKSLAWYQGQKQQAGTRQKTDDPERVKFETEKAKFNNDREQSFRQDIGKQTLAHQRSEVDKVLAPYLKTKSLTADERADITAGINGRVNALLKADGTYRSQMKALLAAKNRDPEKIIQYVKAAVSEAAAKAVKARYGKTVATKPATTTTTGTQKTGTTQQNPANAGPLKISAKPNRADVDWANTKDILYITNKAYMKNGPHKGKLVTW